MPRKKLKKVFVLDTSVILYDHSAVTHFEEHDVALPITVLEELDNFKKGNDTKNFEAREFIRFLDNLSKSYMLTEWIPINDKKQGHLKVLMDHQSSGYDATKVFGDNKADHKILNAALRVKEEVGETRNVILVTKDINLRLKAKSLNLKAEDYETGKVKNLNTAYKGLEVLDNVPSEVINEIFDNGSCEASKLENFTVSHNHYFILKSDKNSALATYNGTEQTIQKVDKTSVYGIKPKNAEQTFAINAMLNPEIQLVTIQGVAGTGKTLLALASALEQRRNFKQIFLARPIVPLSNKDIGYLPGDIKSKLNPYMEPLWDNLKFIQNQFEESDKEYKRITDMVNTEKLVIQPLAYIRGRSLSNIFFIVDEAQNLTPHEVKTIITRAGDNTKIIFTGDINQIDTPYLDSQSNGLSYIIDRLQNQSIYAHVALEKGERSDLANLANELL